MLVSVVIPTYNESADIRETLNSLMDLSYSPVEVLVVDASSDETPQIVASYPPDRVRLIRQSRGRGRAAARNEGILQAQGEVVIILNADVRLPPDFIQSILPHYASGADYVLVESRISNIEHATARYVQALHEFHYPPHPDIEARINWTEGFSCRRDAALQVDLIPEGGVFTLVAGEDAWFGDKLESAGYRKIFDHKIMVSHVMPPDMRGFWYQRVGRGQGTVQIWHLRYGWSVNKLVVTILWLTLLIGLGLLLPLPALWRGWMLTRFSPRGGADWLTMAAVDWVASAANLRGLWVGLAEVLRGAAH